MLMGKLDSGEEPLESLFPKPISIEPSKQNDRLKSQDSIQFHTPHGRPDSTRLSDAGSLGPVSPTSPDLALLRRGRSLPEQGRDRNSRLLRPPSPDVAVETRWDVMASRSEEHT